MAVYLFWGQEEYLMEKEIKKLKSELLDSSFLSMAYKVFDNPPFNTIMDCVQSAPLMFGNTLTLINIDKYLTGKTAASFDDKQISNLDKALSSINDKVNIIFVCKIPRDENKKPDSRKKFFKTLSKYSMVKEFVQIPTYKAELNSVIAKIAKEKGVTISSSNIELLKEQLGSNLTLIDSELEKLQIAIHPNKSIEANDIKKYCKTTEDVFLLADLIIQGDKNEILKQYNILTEKRHPLEIFATLQTSFQRFVYIKNYEKTMPLQEIATSLKLHEYIVKLTKEKLAKTSLNRLVQIRRNLINAEYKLKSGQTISGETALELVLLN